MQLKSESGLKSGITGRYKFFNRLLASYLVIFIIPICMGVLVYRESLRIIENDTVRSNISMLEQSRDIIDRRLEELDSVTNVLAANPYVVGLSGINGRLSGSPEVYNLWSAFSYMSSIKPGNNFVLDYMVVYKDVDIALSTREINLPEQNYYGRYIQFRDLDYKKWKEFVFSRHFYRDYMTNGNILVNNTKTPAVLCLKSIISDYPRQSKGCIVAFINESELRKLISHLNNGSQGYAYILDQDGQVIVTTEQSGEAFQKPELDFEKLGSSFNYKTADGDMKISSTVSKSTGWRYVSVLPASFVMSKVSYIKNITLGVIAVSLLVGMLLAYLLAYQNTKPIKSITSILKNGRSDEAATGRNEFEYLKCSINDLISNNSNLQTLVQEQVPLLKITFLERLLNGRFADEEEILSFVSHLNIEFKGNAYCVLILRIEGYQGAINQEILKEISISRAIMLDLLEQQMGGSSFPCGLDGNRTAILLTGSYETDEAFEDVMDKQIQLLHQTLREQYHINTSFSVGAICKSLKDVSYSFEQAVKAMEYRLGEKDEVAVWYKDIPKEGSFYFYPLETETRLINALKTGDVESMTKILDTIYTENFLSRKIESKAAHQFIHALRGTIIRVAEQIDAGGKVIDLAIQAKTSDGIDKCYKEAAEIFSVICRFVNEQKAAYGNKMKQDIVQYINSAFMQCNLQLGDVATYFHLSETYLYKFFKDEMGMTFADYIENSRIQHACKLLVETGLSINEISEASGYNSSHAFRRAFKRVTGVLPTDYRDTTKISLIMK